MDSLVLFSKKELFAKCKELGITSYKSKNKSELIALIDEYKEVEVEEEELDEKEEKEDAKMITLTDLFCGTGAFSYAFHQTNQVQTIFANDMLDSSEAIFNLNHQVNMTKRNLIDIPTSDIPASHILTAGFPCQPFSIAGMQKGFNDERSNVFWKILSIIAHNSPQIVILENVKNLVSHDDGNTFRIIMDHLQKLGYHIKYAILNTSKITGIPHHRERIYIVCFQDKRLYDRFTFDFPEVPLNPVSAYLEPMLSIPEKYYYSHSTIIYNKLQASIRKHVSSNTIYQYRRYYVRENKNNVCPTLTANMGGGGHNVPIILDDRGIRKLTPRECFNLQGFPPDYLLPTGLSSSKLYALAGNAVSVPVVQLIANSIMELYPPGDYLKSSSNTNSSDSCCKLSI